MLPVTVKQGSCRPEEYPVPPAPISLVWRYFIHALHSAGHFSIVDKHTDHPFSHQSSLMVVVVPGTGAVLPLNLSLRWSTSLRNYPAKRYSPLSFVFSQGCFCNSDSGGEKEHDRDDNVPEYGNDREYESEDQRRDNDIDTGLLPPLQGIQFRDRRFGDEHIRGLDRGFHDRIHRHRCSQQVQAIEGHRSAQC